MNINNLSWQNNIDENVIALSIQQTTNNINNINQRKEI